MDGNKLFARIRKDLTKSGLFTPEQTKEICKMLYNIETAVKAYIVQERNQ